jgi:Leucine-rich repeat (LRR) protein
MRIVSAFLLIVGVAMGLGCGSKPAAEVPKGPGDELRAVLAGAEAVIHQKNGYTRIEKDKAGRDVYSVQFRDSGPKDADLPALRAALENLPILVDFNLNGDERLTDAGLAHLKGWKTLNVLRLDSPKITQKGLENLADLAGLEELTIVNDKITDDWLAPIGKLTNLRRLSLYTKKTTPAAFAHLEGLTRIEEIHVGDRSEMGDEELSHMTKMSRLRALYAGGDKISDAGLAQLKHFPELRDLTIFVWASAGDKITPEGLANLAHLKKLEKLFVHQCPALTKGMAAFAELKELRDLNVQSCYLTPEGLAYLAALPNLRQARLDNPSDAALEKLQGSKSLEDLTLFYTGVGDEGCKHLAKLTTLKNLNLSNTNVGDEGCKHLAAATQLRELILSHTRITDVGLAELKGLKNLEKLRVGETKVTPAAIAGLKQSLPNAKIEN